MKAVYNPGTDYDLPTFLLLHGMGGHEMDLLKVAQKVAVHNGVLGIRGMVMEDGHRRFFHRFQDGSLDEADLVAKTKSLQQFIYDTAVRFNFNDRNIFAIGYSNGANMAGSLLFEQSQALNGAILFHPMIPRQHAPLPDLKGIPIFISAGATDDRVLPGESMALKKMLVEAGADVTFHLTDHGHALVDSEIQAAADWYCHTVHKS